MIEGIRLYTNGVTEDGEQLDTTHATLAVTSDDADRLQVELCLRCGDPFGHHPEAPDAGLASLSLDDLYAFNAIYAGKEPEDLPMLDVATDLRLVRDEIVTRELALARGSAC